ncbi:hypothetical protein CEXT_396261 [Caerostris extrusa]|uniref:Uncharacterized protein n=1 Tax=Caerostris extrusa TaxID=172846 RepID=A0AAV4NY48_CAEEX|nr:hypothetical protein CEXT_396261 [Caerostris extrusa]
MWPDLKIVLRKPNLNQTQGSAKRAEHNIENMLSSWLDNNHGAAKLGLKTSSFPNDSVEHLTNKEELQTLTKTANDFSESTNSKIEDDSDLSNNNSSRMDPPTEITFEAQKEDKATSL